MFQVFVEEKLISTMMILTLLLSMSSRILTGILYQNMIKETDNMSSTNNKILKQCKLKFVNCYQLNRGVSNVPIFVDKFLSRLSVGPFSLHTMYHLSGQLMLLSVFFSGLGVCKSIISGRSLGDLLPFYIVSFFGLYLYFSISAIADIKGKRRVLKINLVDYLENHMVNKLSIVEKDTEILNGRGRTVEVMPFEPAPRGNTQAAAQFTKSEEKELEELLKEFLTS